MSITSANAILLISVDVIFPTPVQIQKFATDDIYGIGNIRPNEVRMGADGNLAAGKIWQAIPVNYHLMADSPSNDFFDQWKQQEDANVDTFRCQGTIKLTGIGKTFTLQNGSLTGYLPAPPAGIVLNPRVFEITWEHVFPSAG